MKLSDNFTLRELYKSPTALRLGIDNAPKDSETIWNLENLCLNILQPIRNHYRIPFTPSSGYRSPELNEISGGKPTSQHMRGEAADIEVPGISNYDLACFIRDNLNFDQVVLEFYESGKPSSGWVHVSYTRHSPLRRSILTTSDGKIYKNGLIA